MEPGQGCDGVDPAAVDTVVIGLGNPTLSDDGVGPAAGREVAGELARRPWLRGIRVTELGLGGLTLMEAMVGCRRAVVLDAVRSGQVPPGTVVELAMADLAGSLHETSVHDMSLPAALAMGRALGLDLPTEIRVLGVEVVDTTTFGETLTAPVAAALPELVGCVLATLESEPDARFDAEQEGAREGKREGERERWRAACG
jgi:hydrogenase maturation protease